MKLALRFEWPRMALLGAGLYAWLVTLVPSAEGPVAWGSGWLGLTLFLGQVGLGHGRRSLVFGVLALILTTAVALFLRNEHPPFEWFQFAGWLALVLAFGEGVRAAEFRRESSLVPAPSPRLAARLSPRNSNPRILLGLPLLAAAATVALWASVRGLEGGARTGLIVTLLFAGSVLFVRALAETGTSLHRARSPDRVSWVRVAFGVVLVLALLALRLLRT